MGIEGQASFLESEERAMKLVRKLVSLRKHLLGVDNVLLFGERKEHEKTHRRQREEYQTQIDEIIHSLISRKLFPSKEAVEAAIIEEEMRQKKEEAVKATEEMRQKEKKQ